MRQIGQFLLLATTASLIAVLPLRAAESRGDLLATRDWVADHLHDPHLVLLHVGSADEYKAAHLPGARLVTMAEISAPMDHSRMKPGDLMLELPDATLLRTQLEKLGISDDSTIVVYYGNDWFSPSTRIVLTLTYAGLGDRTKLLDGSMQTWIREGRATTTEVPAVRTGHLSALHTQPVVVDASYVQAHERTPGTAIVDARDRAFYDGVQAGGDDKSRVGHIPGAHSVPFAEMFDERGNLRSTGDLEAIFAKAGVKPHDTVVGYCHIGQQATAMLFAARTLGHPVLLYDGSMDDWNFRKLPLELPGKGGGR